MRVVFPVHGNNNGQGANSLAVVAHLPEGLNGRFFRLKEFAMPVQRCVVNGREVLSRRRNR